jgi:hypothetical protein
MRLVQNNLEDIHNIQLPYDQLSDKYKHLPDSYFLKPLIDRGFEIDSTESKGLLGTRLIRLSHPKLRAGTDKIQVVAANSHDGTKAFNLFLGIFRLVCSNGLIVGESFTDKKPIRHIGNGFYEKVDTRVDELLRETDRLVTMVERMKHTTEFDRHRFINEAFQLRFTDDHENGKFYKPQTSFARAVRSADFGNDLWTTYNVLQEKLIRGGFRYTLDSKGERSVRTAKGSTNINTNVKINTQLWDLAQSMVS